MEILATIYTIDIITLLFLFILLNTNRVMENNLKRSFSYTIVLTVIIILSEVGTILVGDSGASLTGLNIFFNIVGFSLSPFIPIFLIGIFDARYLKTHKVLFLPAIINAILVLLSPFFKLIFYVDSNNNYIRGSIFFVFAIIYIINILLLVVITWHVSRKKLYPIKWKIAALASFTIIGTFIQIFSPAIYSTWHCVTLSLLLFYIILFDFEGSFDALTQIYNRTAFEKKLLNLKGKKMFSIIMIDINDFKAVNDTWGHEYGDIVLKEVAETIKNSFDSSYSHYRIGGDEFCIISKDINRERIDRQLEELNVRLTKRRKINVHFPTVAFGYSLFQGESNSNVKKTLNEADGKMYEHKQKQKQNIDSN